MILILLGAILEIGLAAQTSTECTDLRNNFMVQNDLVCDNYPYAYDKLCKHNANWAKQKFCQRSCFENGAGYDGDVCCAAAPHLKERDPAHLLNKMPSDDELAAGVAAFLRMQYPEVPAGLTAELTEAVVKHPDEEPAPEDPLYALKAIMEVHPVKPYVVRGPPSAPPPCFGSMLSFIAA